MHPWVRYNSSHTGASFENNFVLKSYREVTDISLSHTGAGVRFLISFTYLFSDNICEIISLQKLKNMVI